MHKTGRRFFGGISAKNQDVAHICIYFMYILKMFLESIDKWDGRGYNINILS